MDEKYTCICGKKLKDCMKEMRRVDTEWTNDVITWNGHSHKGNLRVFPSHPLLKPRNSEWSCCSSTSIHSVCLKSSENYTEHGPIFN